MAVFFDVAYGLVVFLAFGAAGIVPGFVLRLLVPWPVGPLLSPGVGLALAGWAWAGWIERPYGIARAGLVLYAGVGAAGFVRGWMLGIEARSWATRHRPPSRSRGESEPKSTASPS